jgi:aarF domain-containing kinase
LFPNELCQLLGKLHSNGKPHSLAYTKKVIESVFGRPFDEVFEDFPDEPLGIGAVAQVYKATLKQDLLPPSYLEHKHLGTPKSALGDKLAISADDDRPSPVIPTASVAIKILHPKARRTITRDIRIMTFFASMINLLPGAEWLSFPEEVEVFSEMMFSQLDLRNEAANLDHFERNFVKRSSAISFPRPLVAFTSKEILIEEYEDALPLKYFLTHGGGGYDHRIANLGLDAFLVCAPYFLHVPHVC